MSQDGDTGEEEWRAVSHRMRVNGDDWSGVFLECDDCFERTEIGNGELVDDLVQRQAGHVCVIQGTVEREMVT